MPNPSRFKGEVHAAINDTASPRTEGDTVVVDRGIGSLQEEIERLAKSLRRLTNIYVASPRTEDGRRVVFAKPDTPSEVLYCSVCDARAFIDALDRDEKIAKRTETEIEVTEFPVDQKYVAEEVFRHLVHKEHRDWQFGDDPYVRVAFIEQALRLTEQVEAWATVLGVATGDEPEPKSAPEPQWPYINVRALTRAKILRPEANAGAMLKEDWYGRRKFYPRPTGKAKSHSRAYVYNLGKLMEAAIAAGDVPLEDRVRIRREVEKLGSSPKSAPVTQGRSCVWQAFFRLKWHHDPPKPLELRRLGVDLTG